jgi:hypothetical protein
MHGKSRAIGLAAKHRATFDKLGPERLADRRTIVMHRRTSISAVTTGKQRGYHARMVIVVIRVTEDARIRDRLDNRIARSCCNKRRRYKKRETGSKTSDHAALFVLQNSDSANGFVAEP